MAKSKRAETLLAAFGMPGVLTAWGFAVVDALAREAFGSYVAVATDKLDEWVSVCSRAPASAVVLTSQFPERALVKALIDQNVPLVIFLESAVDSLRYLAQCSDQSDIALVRAVSMSLACLSDLVGNSNVMLCRRDAPDGGLLVELVVKMSRHFGLKLTPATFARSLLSLHTLPERIQLSTFEMVAPRLITNYVVLGGVDAEFSASTQDIVAGVLEPFDRLLADPSMPMHIVWPGQVFTVTDRPNQSAAERVGLAGGARCLIYGPYLHLPAGNWSARVVIDLDEATRDQSFAVEVVAADVISAAQMRPPTPGLFAMHLAFAIEKPEIPLEIRISLQNGAIEGAISLSRVELSRISAEPAADTDEDISRSYSPAPLSTAGG